MPIEPDKSTLAKLVSANHNRIAPTGRRIRPGPPAKAEAAIAGYLLVPIYGRKWILINRLPKRKLR